jgi:hypothetical protein
MADPCNTWHLLGFVYAVVMLCLCFLGFVKLHTRSHHREVVHFYWCRSSQKALGLVVNIGAVQLAAR